jgi:2-keto-3-deoxy-6-phosphogluconate aldolase
MIKVCPCGALGGPRYIRELRGPFDRIPLAAVGGVTLDNPAEYFAAGATAVGVSTSLFGKETLHNRDIGQVTGVLNQHPRTAMAHMESDRKTEVTAYFDRMTEATDLV